MATTMTMSNIEFVLYLIITTQLKRSQYLFVVYMCWLSIFLLHTSTKKISTNMFMAYCSSFCILLTQNPAESFYLYNVGIINTYYAIRRSIDFPVTI